MTHPDLRLRLSSCFAGGLPAGAATALLDASAIGFSPGLVRWPARSGDTEVATPLLLEALRQAAGAPFPEFEVLASEGGDASYLHVTSIPSQKMGAIYWGGQTGEIPTQRMLDWITTRENFTVAYLTNSRWEQVQSIRDPTVFRAIAGGNAQAVLRKNPWTNRTEIDVFRNPGRQTLMGSCMWFQAAWRSWFGKHAQRILGRERLLRFSSSLKVGPLTGEILEMELFADPVESSTAENLLRQQAFHDFFDLELQAWVSRRVFPTPHPQFSKLVRSEPQREAFEVRVGRDHDGRIVPHEMATDLWIVTCDPSGRIENVEVRKPF